MPKKTEGYGFFCGGWSIAVIQIVVIDDEVELTRLYAALLEPQYKVIQFNSSSLFLKALVNKELSPNLIICDYKMPDMSGLEMMKKSQEMGFKIPFILLSGYLTKESILEALSFGVFSILEKPVQFEILAKNIESLLSEQKIIETQMKIRKKVTQLQEAFTHVQGLLVQYVPKNVLNNLVIPENIETGETQKSDFLAMIESLESQLNEHFNEQRRVEELKRSLSDNLN